MLHPLFSTYTEEPPITERCGTQQDIYFIFDNTHNYAKKTFCETHFGTELLLRALNPGNDTHDTRVEVVLYPRVEDRNEKREAYTLFPLGTGCREAIGKTLNLVDGFMNYRKQNAPQPASPLVSDPDKYRVQGTLAYPATALNLVLEKINADKTSRQRVVVMIADAENDEEKDDLIQLDRNPKTFEEAEKLRNIPKLTLIAAGNYIDSNGNKKERFEYFLNSIAGGSENVVMGKNPYELVKGIIEKMAAVGAICEEQSKFVSVNVYRLRSTGAVGLFP